MYGGIGQNPGHHAMRHVEILVLKQKLDQKSKKPTREGMIVLERILNIKFAIEIIVQVSQIIREVFFLF